MSILSRIERAAKLIRNSSFVFVTAGAGFGVDSGLPDFRGDEGFWNAYPPFREKGLYVSTCTTDTHSLYLYLFHSHTQNRSFVDLANPKWFTDDPELAWGFYGHRLSMYRNTIPHEGFRVLREFNKNIFVFTSNVDGAFQKAGFDENNELCEVHGSIHHLQCSESCTSAIWSAEPFEIRVDESKMKADMKSVPRCPKCDSVARPNILMFNDWNWISTRTSEQTSRMHNILKSNNDVVVIDLGSGTAVPTCRQTGEQVTQLFDYSSIIRINKRESKIPSRLDVTGKIELDMGCEHALLEIEKYVSSSSV